MGNIMICIVRLSQSERVTWRSHILHREEGVLWHCQVPDSLMQVPTAQEKEKTTHTELRTRNVLALFRK